MAALIGVRFGSGRSRPSSKRIMKSIHRRRSAAIAFTMFCRTFPSTPEDHKRMKDALAEKGQWFQEIVGLPKEKVEWRWGVE